MASAAGIVPGDRERRFSLDELVLRAIERNHSARQASGKPRGWESCDFRFRRGVPLPYEMLCTAMRRLFSAGAAASVLARLSAEARPVVVGSKLDLEGGLPGQMMLLARAEAKIATEHSAAARPDLDFADRAFVRCHRNMPLRRIAELRLQIRPTRSVRSS